jgi:hypothetical protein
MQQNVDFAARIEGSQRNGGVARHWLALHRSQFRHLARELEGMFLQFQRLMAEMDREEESEEPRTQFGALKRAVSERLPTMVQQIRPALIELEFWRPGALMVLDELWLAPPHVLQGPTTWLQHLGQVRTLLLDAIGENVGIATVREGRPNQSQPVDSQVGAARRGGPKTAGRTSDLTEPEYLTPQQVAARYHVDPKTVRRKVRNHPEVRHVTTTSKKGHIPGRVHLRIPVSLADRLWKARSAD